MDSEQMRKVAVLKTLNGIGERRSWVFVNDLWRFLEHGTIPVGAQ